MDGHILHTRAYEQLDGIKPGKQREREKERRDRDFPLDLLHANAKQLIRLYKIATRTSIGGNPLT